MSKTAEKLVDQESLQLLRKYGMDHRSPDMQEAMEKEYFRLGKRLLKFKLSSLVTLYNDSYFRYNKIREEAIKASSQSDKSQIIDPEVEALAEIQTNVYRHAIQMKRQENRKQPKHPISDTLVDYGLFSASTPNKNTIEKEFGNIIKQERNGFKGLRYSNKQGVFLESFDAKVFVGLTKLWFDQGKPEEIQFTFSQLIKAYAGINSGSEMHSIRQSLRHIYATSIVMKEYYDPEKSEVIQETTEYRPIRKITWVLRQGEREGEETAARVVFDDFLRIGNYSFINMVLFNDLSSPTSKILYMNLTRSIQRGATLYEVDSLISHIGFANKHRPLAVKSILQAFEEMKENDIIEDYEQVFGKRNKLEYIKFRPAEWFLSLKDSDVLQIG